MKNVLFATLAVLFVSTQAHAGLLGVQNDTSKNVTVGSYRGWNLPSICESTGYSFCWEEVFEKFKPLTKKHKNIQGIILTDLESQDRPVFLDVEGDQIELLKSCVGYEDNEYVQPISGTTRLLEIYMSAVCIEGFDATIVID